MSVAKLGWGVCPTCSQEFPYRKRKRKKGAAYCSTRCWYNRPDRNTREHPGQYLDESCGRWKVYWKENGRDVVKLRSVWVWEQANGPVPEGYQIHHKDEDRENDVLCNFELKTEDEHHDYHSFQTFSRAVDGMIEEGVDDTIEGKEW